MARRPFRVKMPDGNTYHLWITFSNIAEDIEDIILYNIDIRERLHSEKAMIFGVRVFMDYVASRKVICNRAASERFKLPRDTELTLSSQVNAEVDFIVRVDSPYLQNIGDVTKQTGGILGYETVSFKFDTTTINPGYHKVAEVTLEELFRPYYGQDRTLGNRSPVDFCDIEFKFVRIQED